MVQSFPVSDRSLLALQQRLQSNGNPVAFPNTSIFNQSWDSWK